MDVKQESVYLRYATRRGEYMSIRYNGGSKAYIT